MNRPRRRPPIFEMLFVALAATAATLASGALDRADRRPTEEFTRLTCGLGLGTCVHLSSCEAAFDRRLSEHCSADAGPIVAGGWFCIHHGLSAFTPLPPPGESSSPTGR